MTDDQVRGLHDAINALGDRLDGRIDRLESRVEDIAKDMQSNHDDVLKVLGQHNAILERPRASSA